MEVAEPIESENELRIFNSPEFGNVRTVMIDGEPWLVGKDVATALKYSNPNEALLDHVDAEDKLNSKTLSSIKINLGQRGGWLINESGFYSLVVRSDMPEARKFKHWITHDVIPKIRKYGMYATDELLNNPEFAIQVFQKLKEERDRNRELTEANRNLTTTNQALVHDTRT